MEKKQYELCLTVLRRLNDAGILKDMILIGSWCIPFYADYFSGTEYKKSIRTRDMDFLIPSPRTFKKDVNLPELLKDLGFVIGYKGTKGYIKLEHPELLVEFLVPERGKGTDRPVEVPGLGINAVALRYLDFLAENTILIEVEDLKIRTPHPAAYALHKFIVFKLRRNIDKHDKDIEGALRVFKELIRLGHDKEIKRIFKRMHKKWQEAVLGNLRSVGEIEVIELLRS